MQIKHLYSLLERMVGAARQRDSESVSQLNQEFEKSLNGQLVHQQLSDYDRCRQSCVLAFSMPEMYDKFIADARQRLQGINDARARRDKYA